MADQLERAFRECEVRGTTTGATGMLDRVEARLNGEMPSPFVSPSRDRWWSTLPGPAVAVAAAAVVLLIVVGGVWLFGGPGDSEIAPVEEPSTTATTAATTTTLPPSTTIPTQALEAPWVEAGEIRIGSTIVTKQTLSVDKGTAVLEYDLTSLAPTGTAWTGDDYPDSTPAVLPDRWELETIDAIYEGSSSPVGRSVRFHVDDETTLDDVIGLRLVSWRTIVPVTYEFTIAADEGAAVFMPDGSAIAVSRITEMETGGLVTFDTTLPPDYWSVVPCGDGMVGENCFDPVPGSGWSIRQSDSDLQVLADPGTPLTDVPLRYRRPMWIRAEGSVELPLTTPDVSGAEPSDFPSGYVPLTDVEAVKPTRIDVYGDQVIVSMTSVTRRGVEPGSFDPFMGGRWVLETATGETLDSAGTAFNDYVDGAFTVIFPSTGEQIAPTGLRLAERWKPGAASGAADTGLSRESVVGGLDDAPVDVELDDGSVIRVEQFDIAGVGGYGTWFVPGDEPLPAIANVTGAFVDGEGNAPVVTESWGRPPRNFGLANTGRLFWFWVTSDLVDDDGLAVLPDGELRFEVRVDAEIPNPVPADVVVDLNDVPID